MTTLQQWRINRDKGMAMHRIRDAIVRQFGHASIEFAVIREAALLLRAAMPVAVVTQEEAEQSLTESIFGRV